MTTQLVESYEQTLHADPGSLVFLNLAELLIDSGDCERAIEICQQGLAAHPDSVPGHVLCASALLKLGRAAEAIEFLRAAAQLTPDDAQTLTRAGDLLLQAGLAQEALSFLERAVELSPADEAAQQWLAQAQNALAAHVDPAAVAAESAPSPFDHVAADPGVGEIAQDLPTVVDVGAYVPAPEAAPAASSPFEHVTDDLALGAISQEQPTMVDVGAYVPAPEAVPAAPEFPAAAPLFDEDQRELSAIFRSLGSDDPAPEAAPTHAAVSTADASSADAMPPPSDDAAPRLLSSLLSSPDGMRRTSSEAIRASKGWFSPEDLAAQSERKNAAPAFASVERPRPAPHPLPHLTAPMVSANAPSPMPAPMPARVDSVDEADLAPLTADLAPVAAQPESEVVSGAEEASGQPETVPLTEAALFDGQPEEGAADATGTNPDAEIESQAFATPPPLPPKSATPDMGLAAPPPLPPKGAPPPLPPVTLKPATPRRGGLLDDLPAEFVPSTPPRPAQVPSVMVTAQTAEEIAREYERELREKLLTQPKPTFLRRHWPKMAGALALIAVAAAGSYVFQKSSRETQGTRVGQWRADAARALPLATPQAYRDAIELSERLLDENAADLDAMTTRAFAHAALFHSFGGRAEDRAEAEKHLETIRAHAPGLALAIDYRLEDRDQKITKSKAIAKLAKLDVKALKTGFERAEVHLLLAERLIAQKKLDDASRHLTQSLTEDASHVETLLASGQSLLRPAIASQSADADRAFAMFERAQQISPNHVGAILGLTEAALMRRDQTIEDDREHLARLQKARESYEAAAKTSTPWPEALLPQLDLAEGQLRARVGEGEKAVEILTAGAERHEKRRGEFQRALGEAHMLSGRHDEAAKVFASLSKRAPKNARYKVLHARALLLQGRPREALKVSERYKGSRDLQILHGIALYELNRLERAKSVLISTAPSGQNLPAQAVVYLALIDARLDPETAVDRSLGILANIGPKNRFWSLAQSATGRLLLRQGKEKEAHAALMAAIAKDLRDYESRCVLGRHQLLSGQVDEARKQLDSALKINPFHLEARLALVESLFLLGDLAAVESALDPVLDDRPDTEILLADLRLKLLKGDLDAARRALTRARKADGKDPAVQLASVQFFALSGEMGQARADLKRLRSGNADTRLDLADRLLRQGDFAGAKALYEAARKRDEDELRARVGLAEIAIAAGDKKERAGLSKEIDALVKAISDGKAEATTPVDAEVRARVFAVHAQLLVAAKKKNQARNQADKALEAYSLAPEAQLAKAGAERLFGDAATVQTSIERALRLEPAMARAHLELGVALAGTDRERAQKSLDTARRLSPKGPIADDAAAAVARLSNAPANVADHAADKSDAKSGDKAKVEAKSKEKSDAKSKAATKGKSKGKQAAKKRSKK